MVPGEALSYVWAEIGAPPEFRRIPIVILPHGISINDFQSLPSAPVFLKKRDVIRLNDIDQYLEQLGARVAEGNKDA